MSIKIQQRRDTAATWTSINPVLASGEIGIESDTGKFKIGDGVTHWASLAYALTAGLVTGLAAVATTGAYADLSGKPTLGTAAAQPTSAFDAAGAAASAQSAAQAYADGKIVALVGSAPLALDTLQEIDAQLAADEGSAAALAATVAGKVDKSTVTAKGDLIVATGTATVARQAVGSDGQVLTADSAQAGGVKWATATAGALTRTTVKTANYTAVLWDLIPCDTSGAGFTVTLPAATVGKGRIAVKLVTAGNTLTIALTGTDHYNTSTGPTTGSLTLTNQGLIAESDGAGIWTVTADDLPLTALDTRYVQAASAAPLAQNGQTPSQAPVAAGAADAGSLAFTARADHIHPSAGLYSWYGDGADGNIVLDGTNTFSFLNKSGSTYTMTRPVFAANLTINTGVTLVATFNYLFISGTLTNSGTISNNGNNAAGATAGAVMAGGTLPNGQAGAVGGTGVGVQLSAGNPPWYFGGGGGAGGSGGSGAGGAARTGGPITQQAGAYQLMLHGGPQWTLGVALWATNNGNVVVQHMLGGAGGSSGAGDGTNSGGAGGSGGGLTFIYARILVNSGTITATGGNGGTATVGNSGGGGGGGGGGVYVLATAVTNTGSVTANGGTGGGAVGTGVAGSSGTAGFVALRQAA